MGARLTKPPQLHGTLFSPFLRRMRPSSRHARLGVLFGRVVCGFLSYRWMLIGENRNSRVWCPKVRVRVPGFWGRIKRVEPCAVRATGREPNGIYGSTIRVKGSTVLVREPVLELLYWTGSGAYTIGLYKRCEINGFRFDWRIVQLSEPRERPAHEANPSRTTRLKIQRSDLRDRHDPQAGDLADLRPSFSSPRWLSRHFTMGCMCWPVLGVSTGVVYQLHLTMDTISQGISCDRIPPTPLYTAFAVQIPLYCTMAHLPFDWLPCGSYCTSYHCRSLVVRYGI